MSEKIFTTIGITPISDRVIVEPMARDKVTKDGIILSPNAEIPVLKGAIVAMGMKTEEVNVGDKVIFGALSGIPYEINDKKYFMMREADLIAII